MTNGIAFAPLSADEIVNAFAKRLQDREDDVARIASFWNSFEGWLKWELALTLCDKGWARRPWESDSPEATWGTIGVEYKVPLKIRESAALRKQVDLWVCGSSESRWHYIELKVAFANGNNAKQLDSWQSDLERLGRLNDEHAEGRIVMLVAVGFEKPRLAELVGKEAMIATICKHAAQGTLEATPSVQLVSTTVKRRTRS